MENIEEIKKMIDIIKYDLYEINKAIKLELLNATETTYKDLKELEEKIKKETTAQ